MAARRHHDPAQRRAVCMACGTVRWFPACPRRPFQLFCPRCECATDWLRDDLASFRRGTPREKERALAFRAFLPL